MTISFLFLQLFDEEIKKKTNKKK